MSLLWYATFSRLGEKPKSQRLWKSSTFFIHFKSMKSPSVLAVVMKETQPELCFSPEG
jgi:hypothetical protein